MQTTSLDTDLHGNDKPAPPTEATPTPGVLLSYPDWPAVVASLIDAFARLHAAGRPTPGASGSIAPADGRPPDPAALMEKDAFLVGIACRERPGISRMDDSFNGLLEVVMAQHLRVVLQHNRQQRPDGLAQDLPVAT